MAGNTGIEQGLIALGETINGALTPQVESATQALTEAVAGLGEGLKITEKGEEKETSSLDVKKEEPEEQESKEILERENQIIEELENLQEICPEMAEIATQLISANTTLETLNEIESEESEDSKKPLENGGILTDSKDPKDIGKGKTLAEICGTGLAITGNFLKDISEMLFKLVDTACAGSGGLQVVIIDANKSKGEKSETSGEGGGKEESGDSKGKLKNFFAGLAGPLESVAGSLLMLSLCMVILSSISFDSGLIKTLIAFQAFFLVTFAVLGFISLLYLKVGKKYMKEPKDKENKEGSIIGIVKEFALMIFLVAGTVLVAFILSDLILNYWQPIALTLVFLFAGMFALLLVLSATSFLMSKMTGKGSPITQAVLGITLLVFAIAAMAIFCWLFEDIIKEGLGSAMLIFGLAGALMLVLALSLKLIEKVDPEAVKGFQHLMVTTIILVVLIAVLAIILGMFPSEIIISGIIKVGIIMGLIAVMTILLAVACKLLEKVDSEKIKALMGLLIVTGVLLLLIGVLVVVLGSMPTEVIVQGLIAVTAILVLVVGLVFVLSKLSKQVTSKAPQALLAILIIGIFTVAVAGLAFLLTAMLGNLSIESVITSALAIILTVTCMLLVGAMIFLMGALGPTLIPMLPLALVGIGVLAIFTVAVAGIAVLLTTILPMEVAQNAIVAAQAVILTCLALMLMVPLVFLLAVSAIPLVFAVKLAKKALGTLNKFMYDLVDSMVTLSSAVSLLQGVDLGFFGEGLKTIITIVGLLITMVPPFAIFAIVGIVLATLVSISAGSVTIIALGLKIMVWALNSLRKTLTKLPTDLTMEPLVKIIRDFEPLNQALKEFNGPNSKQIKAVDQSIGFYKKIIKSLQKLSTEGISNNIQSVAASLAALSGQADPLEKLGDSLERVANATKALNSYEASNGGIAKLLGLTKNMEITATIMERIKGPSEEEADPYASKLDTIISSLDTILESFTEVIYNLHENVDQKRLDSISTAPTTSDSPSFVGV